MERWSIIWVKEPCWGDVDQVQYAAAEIASRGTIREWGIFLRIAKVYGYLLDNPTPEEVLRRLGKR